MVKKKVVKKRIFSGSKVPETMKLVAERDIALDFSGKVYGKFQQLIKATIMFGSSAKKNTTEKSDIDIVIVVDDASIKWDEEMVATYRQELGKIIKSNPYRRALHINTIKLTTWWRDLMRGDPVLINVIRYGDALIDHAGFFTPLKYLLKEGKIRSTPEAIYTLLQRSPAHLTRARNSLLAAIDGYYWACVDAAHAALISAEIIPPSPEHVGEILDKVFVEEKLLKKDQVEYYNEIHDYAKEIVHGKVFDVDGKKINEYKKKTDEFIRDMALLVEEMVNRRS